MKSTGHEGRQKVLEIIAGEIGNREERRNSVKYNDWYYGRHVEGDDYPWCMAFVQWVFAQAGMALPYKTASCSALLNWYKQHQPARVCQYGMLGDIAIYKGHTGIVAMPDGDNGNYIAIEGNYSDKVSRVIRKPGDAIAFIDPYPPESEFPAWAREDMKRLIDAGILRGTGDAFNLSDDLLRSAVMISRVYDKLNK